VFVSAPAASDGALPLFFVVFVSEQFSEPADAFSFCPLNVFPAIFFLLAYSAFSFCV